MTDLTIQQFYGDILIFLVYLFLSLVIFKGVFMIMSRFFDKKSTVFHHHFHYRDHRKK